MRHLGIVLFLFVFILSVPILSIADDDNAIYVKVRTAKLKPKPEQWAPGGTDVPYGEKLVRISEEGAWLKVRSSKGSVGYLHASALSTRKVVLSSGKGFSDTQADAGDVVLAGKGFNREVEKEYARSNAALDFLSVDRMEAIRVSDTELASFIKGGKLGTVNG